MRVLHKYWVVYSCSTFCVYPVFIVPWIAVLGAGFVLACDILGRVIRFPYEVPVGVIVSVLGSALFIALLVRRTTGAR